MVIFRGLVAIRYWLVIRQPLWGPLGRIVSGFWLVIWSTRLGVILGGWRRRIFTGKWGNQAGGHSGPLWATCDGGFSLVSGATREIPPQSARCSPASRHPVPLQPGPQGRRKFRWSGRQPSLQHLPALQHLPGCLFLKSYLNSPLLVSDSSS